MRERRLPLATGLTYNLLEWEAESDHTVVLIHGFLDFAGGWEPLLEHGLAGKVHVVAPDLRGHGDSDRVGAGGYYHFMDYLPDLADVIKQVGRARVSLVGHSMGGTVASYLAGSYPERIHRLAMLEGIGPPVERQPVGPTRVVDWIDAWNKVAARAPRTHASLEEAAGRLRAQDRLLDPALALRLAARGTIAGPDGRVRFKHDPLHLTRGPYGGFQFDVSARFWRNIACPTLLVSGGESDFRLDPDELARRVSCFAQARSAVIEGAGHMMVRHQPAAVARVIEEFLSLP